MLLINGINDRSFKKNIIVIIHLHHLTQRNIQIK